MKLQENEPSMVGSWGNIRNESKAGVATHQSPIGIPGPSPSLMCSRHLLTAYNKRSITFSHGNEAEALESVWQLMKAGNRVQEQHAVLLFRKRIPMIPRQSNTKVCETTHIERAGVISNERTTQQRPSWN